MVSPVQPGKDLLPIDLWTLCGRKLFLRTRISLFSLNSSCNLKSITNCTTVKITKRAGSGLCHQSRRVIPLPAVFSQWIRWDLWWPIDTFCTISWRRRNVRTLLNTHCISSACQSTHNSKSPKTPECNVISPSMQPTSNKATMSSSKKPRQWTSMVTSPSPWWTSFNQHF